MPKWGVYIQDFDRMLPQVFDDYEDAVDAAEELEDALVVRLPVGDDSEDYGDEEDDEADEE